MFFLDQMVATQTCFENFHPDPFGSDPNLGGGFKHVLFSPLPGEMIQFDYIIFLGWVETTNQQ